LALVLTEETWYYPLILTGAWLLGVIVSRIIAEPARAWATRVLMPRASPPFGRAAQATI
jgi:hypothetical protein